jgi:electron transfer flavoprotein alpha subunit
VTDNSQRIAVVADHFQGRLRPATFDAIACALKLSGLVDLPVRIVTLGEDAGTIGRDLAELSGLPVTAIEIPEAASYCGEVYKTVLSEVVSHMNAAYVCIPATTQGSDYAPALAVRVDAACVSGVESVSWRQGRVCFAVSLYAGKIVQEVVTETDCTVLTVLPGSFGHPDFSHAGPGTVEVISKDCKPQQTRSMGLQAPADLDSALSEAAVIVSAGRGLGKRENLDLIRRLAAIFPKAAVGGSRPVCDAGWLEYKQQVGITGATVSPEVYVACGISGAHQHISGMREARFIIAVNTDPNAAIFNTADICVNEDLTKFIPALIDEWEKSNREKS